MQSCQPLYWLKTPPHYPAAGPFCSPSPLTRAHPPLHPASSPSLHIFISPPLKRELYLFTFFLSYLHLLRFLVKRDRKGNQEITVRSARESQIKLHIKPSKHLKILYTVYGWSIHLQIRFLKCYCRILNEKLNGKCELQRGISLSFTVLGFVSYSRPLYKNVLFQHSLFVKYPFYFERTGCKRMGE